MTIFIINTLIALYIISFIFVCIVGMVFWWIQRIISNIPLPSPSDNRPQKLVNGKWVKEDKS